jgi:FlaA1/EpsC-like NDP-sugar epimerase
MATADDHVRRVALGQTGETAGAVRAAAPPGAATAPAPVELPTGRPWFRPYRRLVVGVDAAVGAAAGALGVLVPLGSAQQPMRLYVAATVPFLWVGALALNRGYERRFAGTGDEEYRSVVRAATSIFVGAAFVSFLVQFQLSRGILLIVLPSLLVLGLLGRHVMRRRLHRRRARGLDLQRTVVIGHVRSVGPTIRQVRQAHQDGLHVVAACVSGLHASGDALTSVEGVPVFGYP